MTPEQALTRLKLHTQPTAEPQLSDQELEDILAVYQLADEEERPPSDDDWVGTWDLRGAARQAWLMKAQKVAGNPSYASDGVTYHLSHIYQHCMAMADKYQSAGSLALGAVNASE